MIRVAVSGIGVVSPLGDTLANVFANAVAGRSGVHRLETSFSHRLVAPLGATARFDGAAHFEPPKLRMLDRVSQFALVCARRALEGAADPLSGLDRTRAGVFVGTGMAGSETSDEGYRTLYGEASDRIKPYTVLMGMHNAPAGWIGIEHALRGPNLTYSTACSSSAVAIGEAWRRVASGELDLALAGGSEAPLSFGSLKAWEALHTLAAIDAAEPSASCKPFSKNRSGMVLGEGAAMLVLEPWERAIARGAQPLGEVIGYGPRDRRDPHHAAECRRAGRGAAGRAGVSRPGAAAVDAINAHGTGTQANDPVETAAIKAVFGARAHAIPVSATKAVHGHLLGAAGALECVLALLAMQHRVALPTMHLAAPDPACDLDCVANVARHDLDVRTMLSSSFAFGGTNAVLALRRAD
jgi:3-oxoacyl-[acyl-carrier-protein] synthase II